jgi:hypothetical protein
MFEILNPKYSIQVEFRQHSSKLDELTDSTRI